MVGWLKIVVVGVSLVMAAGSALIIKIKNKAPIVTEIVTQVHEVADTVIKDEVGIHIPFDTREEETAPVETDSNSTGTNEDKVS